MDSKFLGYHNLVPHKSNKQPSSDCKIPIQHSGQTLPHYFATQARKNARIKPNKETSGWTVGGLLACMQRPLGFLPLIREDAREVPSSICRYLGLSAATTAAGRPKMQVSQIRPFCPQEEESLAYFPNRGGISREG